jgi:hypothetical protein
LRVHRLARLLEPSFSLFFFSFFSKEKRFKGVVGVAITTFDFLKKQHLVLKSSLMIIKKKS